MLKRNKKILAAISSILLIGMLTGCVGGDKVTDKNGNSKVVEFKDGSVTKDELYDNMVKVSGLSVALNMADAKILDKSYPETEDLKKKIDEQIDNMKDYYKDNFEQVLKSNGIAGEEHYREIVRLNLQREAYIKDYMKKNVVTEEEIKAAYEAFSPKVKASHILIKPADETAEALKAAEDKAKEIIKQLDGGADFAELAKKESGDPGSGANGGDLGLFGKGQMVPEFEEEAYALKVGEYSKTPVKSQFGYHIVLKTDEEKKGTLDEMKDKLTEEIIAAKLNTDKQIGDKALIELRKENGLKFNDENIQKQYDDFVKTFEPAVEENE